MQTSSDKHVARPFLILLIAIFIVVSDQVLKLIISKEVFLGGHESIEIFSFFSLVFVRNTGISFGLFNDGGEIQRWLMTSFAVLIGLVILVWAMLSNRKVFRMALALIAGGAFGNAIDRMYFGGVIDFMDFYIYDFHWPAFNLADSSISVGVILLLMEGFLDKRV